MGYQRFVTVRRAKSGDGRIVTVEEARVKLLSLSSVRDGQSVTIGWSKVWDR